MAGVGFALRRLTRQEGLLPIAQGHLHAVLITSGPWLFTVAMLTAVSRWGPDLADARTVELFRSVVIYNAGFSFVLCSPLALVAARFFGDAIHGHSLSGAALALAGPVVIFLAVGLPLAAAFHGLLVDLPQAARLPAILSFCTFGLIWILVALASVMRNYALFTATFAAGLAIAAALTLALARPFGLAGMLWSCTAGLGLVFCFLTAQFLAEYPGDLGEPRQFITYCRRYWTLAAGGLAYAMAVWIDKWVMWLSPQHLTIAGAMPQFPAYDSAMFLAFLTAIPAIALFTIHVETQFHQAYVRLFASIREHAPLTRIMTDQAAIQAIVIAGARNLVVVQTVIALEVAFLAPQLIGAIGGSYLQIGILRLGVLGVAFHAIMLFASTVLLYFDLRHRYLAVQLLFLVLNGGLTFVFSQLGLAWYGYGYFLAALLACLTAVYLTGDALSRLPYHVFVRNNPSV
jgi:uncharacterized membrane protein